MTLLSDQHSEVPCVIIIKFNDYFSDKFVKTYSMVVPAALHQWKTCQMLYASGEANVSEVLIAAVSSLKLWCTGSAGACQYVMCVFVCEISDYVFCKVRTQVMKAGYYSAYPQVKQSKQQQQQPLDKLHQEKETVIDVLLRQTVTRLRVNNESLDQQIFDLAGHSRRVNECGRKFECQQRGNEEQIDGLSSTPCSPMCNNLTNNFNRIRGDSNCRHQHEDIVCCTKCRAS
ncbi:uncharacterized protein V6R79_001558 [Siganus canaliculatus]